MKAVERTALNPKLISLKTGQFFACVVPKPVRREGNAKAQTQSKTGKKSRDSLRSLE